MARRVPAGELGGPDRAAWGRGFSFVCGLDEVGRGPLAGPVVAAAVVFPSEVEIRGLTDSKRLPPSARAGLVPVIRELALGVGVGLATPQEIDRINILQASLRAMARAVGALPFEPDFLLVDGIHRVPLATPQETLVGGDGRSLAVAAASVLAKEHRDALMDDYAGTYPGYGFERHKGYPTRAHKDALARLGPCPIHRTSFNGVQQRCHSPRQPDLFSIREST